MVQFFASHGTLVFLTLFRLLSQCTRNSDSFTLISDICISISYELSYKYYLVEEVYCMNVSYVIFVKMIAVIFEVV